MINYQMQQYRLFPLLATAYAFHFTGRYMRNLYNKLVKGIETSADVSILPEVSIRSSRLIHGLINISLPLRFMQPQLD